MAEELLFELHDVDFDALRVDTQREVVDVDVLFLLLRLTRLADF